MTEAVIGRHGRGNESGGAGGHKGERVRLCPSHNYL